MKIDKKAFIDKYVLESEDILKKVNDNILYLEKFPEDKNIINELMRSFHTIKGTSRMMGFGEMSDIAHTIEDLISTISRNKIKVTDIVIDFLIKLSDLIKVKLYSIKKNEEIPLKDFIGRLSDLVNNEAFELLDSLAFPEFEKPEEKKEIVAIDKSKYESDIVKINIDRLDVILKDVNEVMNHYLNVKNTTGNLLSSLHQIKGFLEEDNFDVEDLYQNFYGIYKGYREHLGRMEIYISQIQNALYDLKMLPISIIFDQLPKAARDIARQLKKRVEVSIESENSYLDKGIIEKFDEPIIHLLRNAIAHGIESPEERRQLRKNEIGKITIKSYMESGNIIIKLSDDGRGIDVKKIRENAVKKGILSKEKIESLSNDEIVNLIFLSEMSTSEDVDDISGRGVGMEIIKKSIEDLKGSIAIKTEHGKGTEFAILLPITLSTISVIFISCNGITFAIPISYIEEILVLENSNIIEVSNSKAIKNRDMLIKITELKEIFPINLNNTPNYRFILILKSLELRLGILIDDIINETEIVIKPVPAQLKAIKTIMGVTINNLNEISNILHIPSIISHYLHLKETGIKQSIITDSKQKKTILIVDDSESVRNILKGILIDADYEIDEAENGEDALNMMLSKRYDIVLSDIKMPVMDGLNLLKSIKYNKALQHIPVIMISTLRDDATIQKARTLGASKYIVKDKFKAKTLIKVLDDLLK